MDKEEEIRMKKEKIAIITGASSGFGLVTSLELAKNGYLVYSTMRNTGKSDKLMSLAKQHGVSDSIKVWELDVTNLESIQEFERSIKSLDGIEILVNNAGFAGAGFVEEIPLSEYRNQFETNFFGAISVTQVVLPIMRKQRHGKIINVSSISGKVGFLGISPYVSSKFALEGWSEALRLEMVPFGVDVVLVEPGSFQTNIWSTGKKISKKSQLTHSPYYETMKSLESHLEKQATHYDNPILVANLILAIANKKNPTLRYPIGKGVKLMILLKTILPWRWWEKIVLSQLKS